ncbi:MAG: hypothetical protein CMN30_22090 [Sandaracinus sp.]|nr:hypothetical protein [Sandaracinus sp.]MAR56508.1 hypothetical protein [Rickettsiales bacterium]
MPRSFEALLAQLDDESRSMAQAIATRRPDLTSAMEADPEHPSRLRLLLPSPTGESSRDVLVWMRDDEPSLGFGPWHTHATVWAHFAEPREQDEALAELLLAILEDQLVICVDVGGPHDGSAGVIDLREPTAITDALTEPGGSGHVRLLSWGGTKDAEHRLDDGQP